MKSAALRKIRHTSGIDLTREARKTSPDAERVRAIAKLGPVIRIKSGFPTLDDAMRGGIPLPRTMGVGGAPGAGKTSLAVGQAYRAAKSGIPAVILAKDEGTEGIDQRIALLEGIDVDALENRDPAAIEALAVFYESHPLRVLDGDEHTIETAAAVLASMRKDGDPAVLVIDSAQTVDAEGTAGAASPRERADCVVRATKGVTRRFVFWTILTSELNRGFYRSKRNEDAVNPLAAFKESGGIEYGLQTALVLTSSEGDGTTTIEVAVPKNRGFKKTAFFLRLDPKTTAVDETAAATADASEPIADRFQKTRQKIMRTCAKVPGLGTATKIHAAVGGEKSYALRVIKALIDDGDLVLDGDSYRPKKVTA